MQKQSPDKRASRYKLSGIVVRLRFFLVCIATVVSAACVIAFYQSERITRAHNLFVEQSVPQLLLAQQSEADLNGFSLALDRVSNTSNRTAFKAAFGKMTAYLERVRGTFDTLATQAKSSSVVPEIGINFDIIDQEIDTLSKTKSLFFSERAELKELSERVAVLGAQAKELLLSPTFLSIAQIDGMSEGTRESIAETIVNRDPEFSEILQILLNLINNTRNIEAVSELVTMDDLTVPGTIRVAMQEERVKVTASFDKITELIARLRPSVERTRLADLVTTMQGIAIGTHGIFELANRQLDRLSALDAQRESTALVTANLSDQFSSITADIRARVAQNTQHLSAATQSLNITVGAVFILAVTVIMVGNSVVVEKQINDRMARLATAVNAIAANDLAHEIDVGGNDELGDIARALTIFKRNAEELHRSNTDLERFAYVAAHDLRTPLRAIHDLAEWTMEDSDNVLSPDSKEYLELLKQRISRLNRLLADLLDYARAGQNGTEASSVHLDNMVDEVASILSANERFEVTFQGPLEPVMTLATPLHQILLNLMSNAIKHHDRPSGTVMVSAKILDDRLQIEFSDDGPGIPKEYQDKVFVLFQTLKPRDEVEGSGLGLAIIRKLIERYNGSIELVSDPQVRRGACFRFDLPLSEHSVGNISQPKAA